MLSDRGRCRVTRGYCRCGKYRGHVNDGDLMHLCLECADVSPDRPKIAEWSRAVERGC